MKKDITRDYATDAFRLYAALGKSKIIVISRGIYYEK